MCLKDTDPLIKYLLRSSEMGKVKIRLFGASPLGTSIFCWLVSIQAESLVVKLFNGIRAGLTGFQVSHTGTNR